MVMGAATTRVDSVHETGARPVIPRSPSLVTVLRALELEARSDIHCSLNDPADFRRCAALGGRDCVFALLIAESELSQQNLARLFIALGDRQACDDEPDETIPGNLVRFVLEGRLDGADRDHVVHVIEALADTGPVPPAAWCYRTALGMLRDPEEGSAPRVCASARWIAHEVADYTFNLENDPVRVLDELIAFTAKTILALRESRA